MEIQLKNMSYAYRRQPAEALSGLNANLTPGIYLLLGENGAGKTTLLHVIAGLRFPTEGECMIDGSPTRLRLPGILSRVAYMGDNMEFPAGTIEETVACHACFYPDFDMDLLHMLLGRFGLTGFEKLRELSLGNRHKSQLAYMLSLRTPVLLLDEPANGLDIESRQKFQQMIAECVMPDQTVIVSTHTFADLRHLYDGVMILSHGHLLMSERIDRILDRVVFGSGMAAPDDALFSELRLGREHYMRPRADGDPDTDIDYLLLYNALKSPSWSDIVNHINC